MPKLTDRFLAALTVEEGRKDRLVFDTACPGLGIRLTVRGTRTFIVQWTDPATKGKVREPLGVWGSITIEQARDAARARLGAVAKGIDPKAERQRRRNEAERERSEAALTFDALIKEWATLHLAQRRERYRAEAVRAIRLAFADLLKRPAARVTRADAVNALDKLLRAGKLSMAGRTLAYARAAFRWAERRGKVPSNPFQGLPIVTGTSHRHVPLMRDTRATMPLFLPKRKPAEAGLESLGLLLRAGMLSPPRAGRVKGVGRVQELSQADRVHPLCRVSPTR